MNYLIESTDWQMFTGFVCLLALALLWRSIYRQRPQATLEELEQLAKELALLRTNARPSTQPPMATRIAHGEPMPNTRTQSWAVAQGKGRYS